MTFVEIDWDDQEGAVQMAVVSDDDREEGEWSPPRTPISPHGLQPPQQWWPDDRAWAVATEIDADFTIVGGCAALVDELVAHLDLEAYAVAAQDSLRDTINPEPPGAMVTRP